LPSWTSPLDNTTGLRRPSADRPPASWRTTSLAAESGHVLPADGRRPSWRRAEDGTARAMGRRVRASKGLAYAAVPARERGVLYLVQALRHRFMAQPARADGGNALHQVPIPPGFGFGRSDATAPTRRMNEVAAATSGDVSFFTKRREAPQTHREK